MTRDERSAIRQSALREFLATDNLLRALVLSAVVTALSIPRIFIAGWDLFLYVPAALISMTLICGTITAWSGIAPLSRLFPSRDVLLKGVMTALVFGIGFGVAKAFLLDPILEAAMVQHLPVEDVVLHFPKDACSVLALVLWVAGFETMFFEGGTMSLWARVTGNSWVATGVTMAFKLSIVLVQMNRIQLGVWLIPTLLAYAVAQMVGCRLLVREGLLPVMLYNAALQVGLLFDLG